MEVNKFIKYIIIILMFNFNFFVYSQIGRNKLVEPSEKAKSVELHLFVDGKETEFYSDMLNTLSNVPLNELDEAIISELIETKLYQNVEVEKLLTADNELIFVAKAFTIKRIQEVIMNGLSNYEASEYLRIISTQKGQPFNESVLKSDKEKLEKNLNEHGYLNAKIESVTVNEVSSEYVQVNFNIEKKNPCRVDQVLIEDSLSNILNFLTVPIETGSICDFKSIRETLEIQKENYLEQGYLQANVKIKDISYSANKESAKIVLQIDRGPKTTFQIYDQDSGLLNQDFLITKQGLTYSDIILMSDSDLLSILTSFYQKQGYAFPNISGPERIVDKNGNTILKFLLKKGPLVKIGKINFIGILPVSEDKVLEYIGLEKGFFSTGIPFSKDNISDYRDKLRNLYLEEGYADVQVAMPDFIPSQDKSEMNLIFRIDRGSKYTINEIKIDGAPKGFELDKKKLALILESGTSLSYLKRKNYIDEIRRQLLLRGYLYNQILINQNLISSNSEIKKIDLTFNIIPGPIVRIRKIYVDSDIIGKNNAIISSSNLESGDVFSQESFDNARLRILKHDLFSSVYVEALDNSALERKDLRIDIIIHARAKTGYSLGLSPQFSTYRGYIFAVDFTLNKLNDDGLRFFSNASVSQEKQQQTFASSETRQILGRQISLGLSESLFKLGPIVTPIDMSSTFGYQVAAESLTNREYFTINLSGEWKPSFFDLNWTFRQSIIQENSKSTSSESAVVQTIESPSISIKELLSSITLDTRNNIAWPTSGSLYNIQAGFARFGLGSQVQFNRYNFSVDSFFPIYKKLSGAVSIGGKFIMDTVNESGSTVTPPASRRSTLSDAALVRGFPESGTPPGPLLWIHYANNGVANCNTQLASLGATNLLYMKAESRYRFNEVFGMVLFADSAANYFTQQETNQINAQMNSQVAAAQASTTQCVPDGASLITPSPVNLRNLNFIEQYWQEAYVSTGIGFRLILGNYATINLDYGYPLKDPSSGSSDCVSPAEALNSSSPPKCVTRIQDSNFTGFLKFKGAIHLKIGAQF